jgi:hypothetical protein
MKTFVTLAFLGYASAQLQFCESSDECVDEAFEGGCCHYWEIVQEAETPVWGAFEDVVFNGNMAVGEGTSACFSAAHVAAREAASDADGLLDNYTDLEIFLEQNPGADVLLGLESGATADDWITGWGSDLNTHEKMIIKSMCIEDVVADSSNMLVASLMTLAAVAVAAV